MIYQHFTVLTNAPNGNLSQAFLSKETKQKFRHVGILSLFSKLDKKPPNHQQRVMKTFDANRVVPQ
jgi:hypothetical protein